jgi:hypothetical protein
MLDTIIRSEIIINGTGSPGVNGGITDSAHEEIDADGAF